MTETAISYDRWFDDNLQDNGAIHDISMLLGLMLGLKFEAVEQFEAEETKWL